MRHDPAHRPPLRLPTLEMIHAAARIIEGMAVRTSLVRLASPAGGRPADVLLKLETAQPIRSFKIRGAGNAAAHAQPHTLANGIWTASAGNMAQGAAWVARERGVPCHVVVPDHAPAAKLDVVAALGATIERVPFAVWWNALLTHAHPGMTGLMIHPFADTHVMAGNATIGLELAADAPDLDAVLVPWGGGGLALGIAAALRHANPRTKVWAVEVETAAPLTASLAAGQPVTVQRTPTWIDGMGSDRVSDEMWPLVPGLIAGTMVVTVAQVAAALRLVAELTGTIAEGAGAATVAAALWGEPHPALEPVTSTGNLPDLTNASLDGARVACIISGGNIDPDIVRDILNGDVT